MSWLERMLRDQLANISRVFSSASTSSSNPAMLHLQESRSTLHTQRKNAQTDGTAKQNYDGKPPSPRFFNFDGFPTPSAFFRPPIWTGAGNAADGLLGCQAPAADGLDETFSVLPELELPAPAMGSALESEAVGKSRATNLPAFPVEIHLQILSYVVAGAESQSCSFCRLFELSTLSRVSRLYHSLLEPLLYSTLHLDFNTSIDTSISLIHRGDDRAICDAHLRLGAKHEQLELRVPLLLRTLAARPDIARSVREIILPPGGTQTYLTCALEKTLLPSLVRACVNVREVRGVATLLARQFFAGEHFCLDSVQPQQHGALAIALHEARSLRRWAWHGGSASGRDFVARVWDSHPALAMTGFVGAHRHWAASLEHLEIRDVWGVDEGMLARLMPTLTNLRSLTLVGVRKRCGHNGHSGGGDARTVLKALEAVPASVRALELGNVDAPEFLAEVGEWVRVRHTVKEFSVLESLRITRTPVTVAGLDAFLAAISVQKVTAGNNTARSYLPLLDFRPRWRSVVRLLAIDNDGFEGSFDKADEECGPMEAGVRMELAGLDELDWRMRDGEGAAYLETRLRAGWFDDLKVLTAGSEAVVDAAARARDGLDAWAC